MSAPPGVDWLQRFRAGDADLFRDLVRAESPHLLGYATHLLRDRGAAEELVQDVWVQAYRRRDSFRGEGPILGWLIAICRSESRARWRTEARHRVLADAVASQPQDRAPPLDSFDPVAERRAALAAAIADLPDQQRNVVIHRVLEERSTRETAALLGVAEGTVKATLHRALKNLCGRMGNDEP